MAGWKGRALEPGYLFVGRPRVSGTRVINCLLVIWLIVVFSLFLGQKPAAAAQPKLLAKIRKEKRGKKDGKQPFQRTPWRGSMSERHVLQATEYTPFIGALLRLAGSNYCLKFTTYFPSSFASNWNGVMNI
jgi:hypothetical protein